MNIQFLKISALCLALGMGCIVPSQAWADDDKPAPPIGDSDKPADKADSDKPAEGDKPADGEKPAEKPEEGRPKSSEPALSLTEIGRMINNKTSPDEIVDLAKTRGMDFKLDKPAEARLKRYKFTEEQIAALKKIESGEANGKPGDKKPAEVDPKAKNGMRHSDGFHDMKKEQAERILKTAGLGGYKRYECNNVTLICTSNTSKSFVPFVQTLEKDIAKRFPGILAKGLDKRSAHIFIADTTYDYHNWIKAMWSVYKADRMPFSEGGAQDQMQMMMNAPGFLTGQICSNNFQVRADAEARKRSVSHQVGYMYMSQLSEGKSPASLATGFGNVTEVMAMKSPTVMVNSYQEREIGNVDGAWSAAVKKLVKEGKIKEPGSVFRYDTAQMKPENYAEAWSLTSLLASSPKKLESMIRQMREGKKPLEAIEAEYTMDEAKLFATWKKFADMQK